MTYEELQHFFDHADSKVEAAVDRDRRMAERKAAAEAERMAEAQARAAAAGTQTPTKKKRGPADNMDPDIDL